MIDEKGDESSSVKIEEDSLRDAALEASQHFGLSEGVAPFKVKVVDDASDTEAVFHCSVHVQYFAMEVGT